MPMERLSGRAKKLGIHLTARHLEQFEVYYRELVAWNERVNLTSITEYGEVQVKHFLDSLTVTLAIKNEIDRKSLSVIDVGTGAGMPGVPLKIVFPQVSLTLLEATAKKTRFLEYLAQKLDLKDVEIVTGRAEEAAHNIQHREKYDVVLSRAVAPLPALVELTLPFCKIGGYCIAQKKGDIAPEIAQSRKAINLMGGSLQKVIPVELDEFDAKRCLVVIEKIDVTPEKYPRRPGMPEKRPIVG